MTRPNHYSDEINHQVVEVIYPKVLKWLQDSGDTAPEDDAEGIKQNLFDMLDSTIGDESYQLMKYLDDRCYWTVDADLQSLLEEVAFARYKIHDEAVAKWVTENNIVAELALGAPVEFTRDGQVIVGEILKIDAKQGVYAVHCPSLGHVKTGIGTHATILPFEDVRPHGPAAQQSEVR
jgi:hypothetical protein